MNKNEKSKIEQCENDRSMVRRRQREQKFSVTLFQQEFHVQIARTFLLHMRDARKRKLWTK